MTPGFNKRFGDILERLNGGAISRRQAAIELGIGYATLKRLLEAEPSGEADKWPRRIKNTMSAG